MQYLHSRYTHTADGAPSSLLALQTQVTCRADGRRTNVLVGCCFRTPVCRRTTECLRGVSHVWPLATQVRELKTQLKTRARHLDVGTAVHVGHIREATVALENTEQELTVVRLQLKTTQEALATARCELQDAARAAATNRDALQQEHAAELRRLEERSATHALRLRVRENPTLVPSILRQPDNPFIRAPFSSAAPPRIRASPHTSHPTLGFAPRRSGKTQSPALSMHVAQEEQGKTAAAAAAHRTAAHEAEQLRAELESSTKLHRTMKAEAAAAAARLEEVTDSLAVARSEAAALRSQLTAAADLAAAAQQRQEQQVMEEGAERWRTKWDGLTGATSVWMPGRQ